MRSFRNKIFSTVSVFLLATRAGSQVHDLAVSVNPPTGPILVGQLVTFRVAVTNLGPSDAVGVGLTNTLSTNTLLFSVSASTGSCLTTGNIVRCDLGALSSGVGRTIEVAVVPQSFGIVTNRAVVSAGLGDSNPANNRGEAVAMAVPATFYPAGSLNQGRYGHAAVALSDGKVLIVGGITATGHTTTAEIYDPATAAFRFTGSLRTVHDHPTATLLNSGRVLVVGQTAELYDPATDSFTKAGTMNVQRTYHAATALADGRVLISGGAAPGNPTASAEVYDETIDQFALVATWFTPVTTIRPHGWLTAGC